MKLQDMVTKPEQVSEPVSREATNMQPRQPVQVQKAPQQEPQQVSQGSEDVTKQSSTDDLLSKVTKFVDDKSPSNKSEDDIDADVFNDAEFRKKIDALQDPELKQYMLSMRKTGVRGIQERLQEISEMRKELNSLKQGINPGWSPDRIQQLLNDKEFLNAAQQVLGNTGTQQQFEDDGEYVPDSVKQKLAKLEQENSQFKQQWNQFNQQQTNAQIMQEHNRLKERYGNYDANKVDELINGLIKGEVQAGPEVVYKAYYHDENVKRAYEMGRRDAMGGVDEKQQASSFSTSRIQQPNSEIKPEKDETNKQFLNRIIQNKLSQLRH